MSARPRPTWVPRGLLAAQCIAPSAADAQENPWLTPGAHLRVLPSPALGYPICPFTVWRAGQAVQRSSVQHGSGTYRPAGSGDGALVVGAWANDGPLWAISHAGRRTERCTRPLAFVASVPLTAAEYDGGGDVYPAEYRDGLTVDDATGDVKIPTWLSDPPVDAIGAPLPIGPWWSGIDAGYVSADVAWRVKGVPDTPPPYDALQPADALGRAKAMAGSLEPLVATAWSQPPDKTPPTASTFSHTMPANAGATATADLGVALWGASADAAGARWWGFGTTLPLEVELGVEAVPCFAVAALFVFHPTGNNLPALKLAADAQENPMAQPFTEALYEAHANQGLKHLVGELTDAGHTIGCLWTIAVPAPPPDIPDPPAIDVNGTRKTWTQDATWQATLSVTTSTSGPIAALRDPDVSLNQLVKGNDVWRQPIVAARATANSAAVAVTDAAVPPGNATWRVASADLWGQWSPFDVKKIDPPDLPAMPVPTAALELEPAPIAAGNNPASAGHLSITATMPAPAIAAPAIVGLEAQLEGAATPVTLTDQGDGTWFDSTSAPDPTTPGGSVAVSCTVKATDAVGRTTTSPKASLRVHDPRPFIAPRTSGVVLFTGQRGPDGHAELDVVAPSPPSAPNGLTWRLYAADEQQLSPVPGRDEPRWSRGNRLRSAIAAAGTRARMARVADAVITTSDGQLRVRCRLPGRLQSVQAFQLVPTTETGIEAPASSCGCFIVAVPLSDRPPAPTLTRTVDPTPAGTRISLTATVAYPGARPGPSTPPSPIARRSGDGSTPLVARLRRSAIGGDPTTWPVLTTVTLAPDHPADPAQGWRWRTTYTDVVGPEVPAWAPLSYACEAAWPDEPAWDPDPHTVIVPGEVSTKWFNAAAHPSVWSDASAVLTVLAPQPPVSLAPVHTDNGDGTASIVVPVPVIHPSASPWTLAGALSGQPQLSASGRGPELRLDALDLTIPADEWLLALVTPDGTTLPMMKGDGSAP